MSSQFFVNIEAKPYLVEYCRKKFGNPVNFPKQSHLNILLFEYLIHRDYEPGRIKTENCIVIELPFFEKKDVRYFNSLSKAGVRSLRSALNDLLFVEYYREVTRKYKRGETVDSALLHFIEKYDLPQDCFATFRKRIQRNMHRLGVPGEKILEKELKFTPDSGAICP